MARATRTMRINRSTRRTEVLDTRKGVEAPIVKTMMGKEESADDIVVCGGGIIPEEDIVELKKMGIQEIFGPGSALEDIVKWVEENVKPRSTQTGGG